MRILQELLCASGDSPLFIGGNLRVAFLNVNICLGLYREIIEEQDLVLMIPTKKGEKTVIILDFAVVQRDQAGFKRNKTLFVPFPRAKWEELSDEKKLGFEIRE